MAFGELRGALLHDVRLSKRIVVPIHLQIYIAEQDLPKLGNPFVQADNAYNRSHDGAGLGLSVVKGLARLHGGRLEIASKLGEGTMTTILLPLGRPKSESGDRIGEGKTVTAA